MRKLLIIVVGLLCCAAPGAAQAGTAICNVPVPTSDGTVLRANLFLPTPAAGRYPTVLTVTGYNKDATNPTGHACTGSDSIGAVDAGLADKGYAVMLLDDRGTGASQGKWDSWGERTQLDYQDALDWIQAQPWSDGKVATTGGSYMGITAMLVAEADAARVAAGKPRAVRTVWADVPMADAYRDVTFHGGATDTGFIPSWLGLTTGLSDLPPSTLVDDPAGSIPTYVDHLGNAYDFAAQQLAGAALGGDAAYDGPFYRLRSPVERAAQIRVPVAIDGGWWDIFQRGEPLLYEKLVNSPHRKLFMSPHYHVSSGPAREDPELRNKWFDRWLKDAPNGVENTPDVSLYAIGGDHWEHYSRWPVPGVRYSRAYLDDDGALSPRKPKTAAGDRKPLLPVSSPCSRMTAQWTAGAAMGPCETDNRTWETTAATYTTEPLERGLQLTGPIVADVWAELTSKDATLVAVLSDVDDSGASNQLSSGFLLASQRKVDAKKSTYGPGRVLIRPYHPLTKDSQQAVTLNEPTLYRIEIYPTDAILAKGHRLRLSIGTADTPATTAPLPATTDQLGGQITLLHGGRYASNVLLPVQGKR